MTEDRLEQSAHIIAVAAVMVADHSRYIVEVERDIIKLARCYAERRAVKWLPIESAPGDGQTVCLYGCFHKGKWYQKIAARGKGVGGLHVNIPTGFRMFEGATHWQPLPQPPKETT